MAEKKCPEISVIVPVYKVEKYLNECINSILAQTFAQFELILVDDGSPDGSQAILEQYAQKDSRPRSWSRRKAIPGCARPAADTAGGC